MSDGDGDAPDRARPARPANVRRAASLQYATAEEPVERDLEVHEMAVASLVCGLFVFVPFICGIMALVAGVGVLRRARRLSPLDLALATIGTALGLANVLLSTLLLSSAFL